MKKSLWEWLRALLFPLICIGLTVVFLTALSNLKDGNGAEAKKQLEEAIRRSVITCYTTEGRYPPNFEYVKETYGIQVDETRYVVVYDVFAENLMPEVTVLERDYEKSRR